MKKEKVHYYSQRHFVNAGMSFPLCYSNSKLLDIDKGRLSTTKDYSKVTCQNCIKANNSEWKERRSK
jgi:hypothetical protein